MEVAESSTESNAEVFRVVDNMEIATTSNNIQTKCSIREIINAMEKKKQSPVILNKCKNIHTGTKIEIHYTQSECKSLEGENKKKNALLINCCEKLKNKYTVYFSYMRSFLWDRKRNDFPLKDYFIELTIEETDLFGKKRKNKISLNEMFSKKEDGHQTLLVTGDPGYGKSTLCKKIAHDWATMGYLRHFDLTIVLILRELGNKSIKNALLHEIQCDTLSNGNWKLQEEHLNILVILDGFDELIEKDKVVKFIREDSFDVFQRMTILVTSRPQATEAIREDMKLRFLIEGFSPEHQQKYIRSMFSEDESKANVLISNQDNDIFYRKIAECPLMLHLLCCLHQYGDLEKMENRTDLYIQIFSLTTERYVKKKLKTDKFKKGRYFRGEELLYKLGRLTKERFPFSSEDLKENFPNEEEYNFIVGLDILTFSCFSEYNDTTYYEFLYKTFEEFLSAFVMFCDSCSVPRHIVQSTFLFLLGFYKSGSFPEKFFCNLNGRIVDSNFVIAAIQEIKSVKIWEQLSAHIKIFIYDFDIHRMEKLMKLYPVKEMYFCLYLYEKAPILHFFNNCSFPSNYEIYLIIHIDHENLCSVRDIREQVSFVIDLFYSVNLTNFQVYFTGILNKNFEYFLDFRLSRNLTQYIRTKLKISENENVIALESISDHETFSIFIMTSEQYEILCSVFKFFTVKEKLKCLII